MLGLERLDFSDVEGMHIAVERFFPRSAQDPLAMDVVKYVSTDLDPEVKP